MVSTKPFTKSLYLTGADVQNDNISTDLQILKQISILTNIFRKTFVIQRNLAATPLQFLTVHPIPKEKNLTYYQFNFSFKSWQFVYSLIIQLLFAYGIIYVFYHIANGNVRVTRYIRTSLLYHESTKNETSTYSTFGDSILAAYICMFFINGFVTIRTMLFTVGDLAKLLNQWTKYLYKFALIFSEDKTLFPEFSKIYKTISRLLRFSVVFTFLNATSYYYISSNCFLPNEKCTQIDLKVSWVISIVGSFVAIVLMMVFCMIDVLNKIVILTFCQLKDVIRSCLNKKSISLKSVFSMIRFLRRQYKLTNRICGPALLVFIGFLFSTTITNWIILLWLYKGHIPTFTAQSTLVFSVVQFIFFLLITEINIRVRKEESEILKVVTETCRHRALSALDQIEVHTCNIYHSIILYIYLLLYVCFCVFVIIWL